LIAFVKMANSYFYEFMVESVRPWMRSELSKYDDPPGFLVWSVEIVESWCESYEEKNFQA